jgi:hypothetical protein
VSTTLDQDQVRLLRLHAQHILSQKPGKVLKPAQLLKKVFALQAQDLPSGMLSLWTRNNALQAEDIRTAMYQERDIVRIWSLRGTLHLLTREDAAWLLPLLGPRFIQSDRQRFTQLGWDEEKYARGLRLLVGVLVEQGPLLRSKIVNLFKASDLPYKGQAPVHFLYRAVLEGVICEGPEIEGKRAFTSFDNWIGKPQPMDQREALEELFLRYLDGYGPVTMEDMVNWSGLKTSEIREIWEDLEDHVSRVDISGKPALISRKFLSDMDRLQQKATGVRLLPRFDTLLLSYANRNWVVDAEYDKYIRPGGGIIAASVLIDGKIQGTWSTQRRKGAVEVMVNLFHSQSDRIEEEILAQVASLGHYLRVNAVAKMIKSA